MKRKRIIDRDNWKGARKMSKKMGVTIRDYINVAVWAYNDKQKNLFDDLEKQNILFKAMNMIATVIDKYKK